MTSGRIRRAQLVAPFGVGAMTVLADGTGVLAAGLDHWFERPGGDNEAIDEEEFRVEEWRLQRALGVEGFRLPPDWRWNQFGAAQGLENLKLPIPFLRFPSWNFCRICRRLSQLPLSYNELPRCPYCAQPGRRGPVLAQVPFVAVCDYGHLQDFPFREWVHRSTKPNCQGGLSLRGTGAASLTAQLVECTCKKTRNLGSITEGNPATTTRPATSFLTSNLATDDEYECSGVSPWHGKLTGNGCGQPLRGSMRAASNVYFALVRSAIFLPRAGLLDPKLMEILSTAPLGGVRQMAKDFGGQPCTAAMLRAHPSGRRLLQPYSDPDVDQALAALDGEQSSADDDVQEFTEEWDEVAFRKPEYAALRLDHDSIELKVRSESDPYSGVVGTHLTGIRLVERLRETRALYGFNRVNPESGASLTDRKALLRRHADPMNWLPAYIVNGEGLMIGLDPALLSEWEQRTDVLERIDELSRLYEAARERRSLRERQLTARFVLLHTFSHLIMNRLTFECGYSSAALRERLFVDSEMASVLIYTAAGDSEGTMGGLVRMGRPGLLEPVVDKALAEARWCSSDPICMECGEAGGQGPDSCNLAACHSCCLVPETACEEFNRFLDRGLLSGTFANPTLGYFSPSP